MTQDLVDNKINSEQFVFTSDLSEKVVRMVSVEIQGSHICYI